MKVSLLFQTQPPGKAFGPGTIHCTPSPTVHSRRAAARWAGLERVFNSCFSAIWKDSVLSGAPVNGVEEGGHSLLPVEVAPICSLHWRWCPWCWLGPRVGGGVSFTEIGDTGRGARCRKSMMSLVLDVMSLKGQWDIRAERSHRPWDVLMNGSWINVQEMLTC